MNKQAAERPARRTVSLGVYLVGLVSVFVFAAGATVVYQRQAAAADARRAGFADARFAAAIAAREVGSVIDQTLDGVVSTAGTAGIAGVFAAPAGCTLTTSATPPFGSGHLDIVSVDGVVACSSLAGNSEPVYAGAPWLAEAMKAPVVAGPFEDARTREQALVIAAAVGSQGVVVTFFNLKDLGPGLSESFGGPRRLEFVVVDASREVALTRSIAPTRWVGTALATTPLAGAARGGEHRDVDGASRLYGEATVSGVGWKILAGAETSQVLAAATRLSDRQLTITLTGLVLFLALVLVIYRRITRPIAKLSAGVRAATAGNSTKAVEVGGPAEVMRLVDDFNQLIGAAARERDVASLLATIVESSPDAIIGADLDRIITSWNPGAERMYGYTAAEVVGKPIVSAFVPPELMEEGAELFQRVIQGEVVEQFETKRLNKDGRLLHVSTSISPIRDAEGTVVGTSSVTRDLTERKRAEAERHELEERIRQAERLSDQERELRLLADRERIGRDLHDTVIQRLFATGLSLQSAASGIPDDRAQDRVLAAVDDLDATIRQIRGVIFNMEQRHLDGIRRAMLDLAAETREVLGFEPMISFDGPVDSVIEPHIADQMLATLREALSNVARHACAHHVDVEVKVGADIALTVTDDGVGVDGVAAAQAGGLGIASMRARAERLGGVFVVNQRSSGGTQVEWRIPLGERLMPVQTVFGT